MPFYTKLPFQGRHGEQRPCVTSSIVLLYCCVLGLRLFSFFGLGLLKKDEKRVVLVSNRRAVGTGRGVPN